MSATPKLADVRSVGDMTKYFRSLPSIREQEEKLARELAESRVDLVAKLAALRTRRAGTNADGRPDAKSELARLAKEFEAAIAEVPKAKAALEAAYARQGQAQQALAAHSIGCDLDQGKIEAALVETADPRISGFIEWCFLAIDRVRRDGFMPRASIEERINPVTGQRMKPPEPAPLPVGTARVGAVIDAIRAAVDAAMALRLAPAADATPELLKLAASIPEVDGARTVDRTALAKILSDDDEPRGRSWTIPRPPMAGSGQ